MESGGESVVLVVLAALVALLVGAIAAIGSRFKELQRRMGVLSRIEAKVDLVLKQSGVTFDPYVNVSQDIANAVREGKKIRAIKLYRDQNGGNLKDAKEFIEDVQRRAGLC